MQIPLDGDEPLLNMDRPSVALPARWSRSQRMKNTALYGAIRALGAGIKAMPLGLSAPLGIFLGLLIYLFSSPFARRMRARVRRAFPGQFFWHHEKVLCGMWCHLCRAVFELGHLEGLARTMEVAPEDKALLKKATLERNGAIVVGGHIGHWELLAQWACAQGYPLTSVAKPLYDPRLTHWVDKERRRTGLKLIWRGGRGGTRALLRALRSKDLLAMLIDQDTRVEGVMVPFFGQRAHTATAPARLAIRRQIPLLVASCRRQGGRYIAFIQRLPVPPKLAPGPAHEAQVYALTCALSEALEQAISAAPSQWVWLHDRWRRKAHSSAGPPSGGPASSRLGPQGVM